MTTNLIIYVFKEVGRGWDINYRLLRIFLSLGHWRSIVFGRVDLTFEAKCPIIVEFF